MIDFFEPLKSFISLLQLHDFEDQLKLLEKKFVVISILFQKYEKLFDQLFNYTLPSSTPSSKSKLSESQAIFTFGWTLFLVSKGKLLKDPPDLLNAFHVLLCCINLLFMHTPSSNRKLTIPMALNVHNEEDLQQQQQEDEEEEVQDSKDNTRYLNSSLLLLCQLCNANFNDVLKVNDQLFVPFLLMVLIIKN